MTTTETPVPAPYVSTGEVLLVEDNPRDAGLILRALQKKQMLPRVKWVKDGPECLDWLWCHGAYEQRSTHQVPKLVLLDLNMPKMSGLDVLRNIRAHARTRHLPVICFTSSMEDNDIRQCYELGVNSYIVKPVRYKRFAKVIEQLGTYWLSANKVPW